MTVPASTLSPCAVTTMVWRFQQRLHLTTAVKATFQLPPNGSMVLGSPLPIYEKDLTYRNLPTSSVVGPSDRAPMKQRADVTLSGRAYARFGTEVTSTQVRLSLLRGNRLLINKTLEIRGDEGGQVPFATMDVSYERAYGGVGYEPNPIGTGVGDGEPPNVVYPGRPDITAGYAPIPAIWPARKKRIKLNRKALSASPLVLPDDFDWTYFQAAPPDQQTDYLEGNETVELDGLHPDAMRASVMLPSARAVGAVYGAKAGDRSLLGFVADALHLEPDERRCTITWRSVIEVEDEAKLDTMVVAAGVATASASVEVPPYKPKVTVPASSARKLGQTFTGEGTVISSPQGVNSTLRIDSEHRPNSSLGAPYALARGRTPSPGGESPKPAASGEAPWSAAKASVVAPEPDQRHTLALPSEARDAVAAFKRSAPAADSVVELDDAEVVSERPEPLVQAPVDPAPVAVAPAPVVESPLDQTSVSARAKVQSAKVEAPTAPHVRGGRLDPARERAAEVQQKRRANPRVDVRKALYSDFV